MLTMAQVDFYKHVHVTNITLCYKVDENRLYKQAG